MLISHSQLHMALAAGVMLLDNFSFFYSFDNQWDIFYTENELNVSFLL